MASQQARWCGRQREGGLGQMEREFLGRAAEAWTLTLLQRIHQNKIPADPGDLADIQSSVEL